MSEKKSFMPFLDPPAALPSRIFTESFAIGAAFIAAHTAASSRVSSLSLRSLFRDLFVFGNQFCYGFGFEWLKPCIVHSFARPADVLLCSRFHFFSAFSFLSQLRKPAFFIGCHVIKCKPNFSPQFDECRSSGAWLSLSWLMKVVSTARRSWVLAEN